MGYGNETLAGDEHKTQNHNMFNSLGQKLHTQTFALSEGLGRTTINFSGFPIGIYFLAIQHGKEREVFKVVRE